MNQEMREADGSEDGMYATVANTEGEAEYSYTKYVALGGRIDEENYLRVMESAREEALSPNAQKFAASQTKATAEISGLSLDAIQEETGIDPRLLYGILRRDEKPTTATHHHSQMSDQQLLVESLRMLGQGSAVSAILAKHPHMQFN